MKRQFLKTTVALGFVILAINSYAEEGGKGIDMGNMKMDCSKHMGDMKGMKGMDCVGKAAAKATLYRDHLVERFRSSRQIESHSDRTDKSIAKGISSGQLLPQQEHHTQK